MTATMNSPYVAIETPMRSLSQRFLIGFSDVATWTRRELMVWLAIPHSFFFHGHPTGDVRAASSICIGGGNSRARTPAGT